MAPVELIGFYSSLIPIAINTETLCESEIVKHLLTILQWEGLDGHAQLSIVMCLSMLTEDRGKRERERERGAFISSPSSNSVISV